MAAVRSLVAYILVSLYVLIIGPIGIAFVLLFRAKGLLYTLGHGGVALALNLAGIRYALVGREHLPANRAVVFCSNHQSNVDPPVLFEALHRRLHVLYKAELDQLPILGRVLQLGGFIAVTRENREEAFRAIERAAASIRDGNSFLIFPEGTRSRTDHLLPFKKGGFVMALRAGAPILPVAVMGGRASMRKGSWVVRPVLVTVRVGEPIETAGMSDDDRDRLIAIVRERIEALLRLGPVGDFGET
jgi:1-acyl-sn-glycerol-3-phosphate acyltransferase